MDTSKLLITGSEGRIGEIIWSYLKESYDVFGIDKNAKNNETRYRIDVSDYSDLEESINKIIPIDYIIHLAGVHPGANNGQDPSWDEILKNNILGTVNIYKIAEKFNIGKVIFASSNHVTEGYKLSANKKIIAVSDPVRPKSNYATSKVFGESIARQYFEEYGIRSICLRLGSVLADDDPTISERYMKTWLSHRDLKNLICTSLKAEVKFGIYYGVSNNKEKFWDISNARKEIGYNPKDDSSLIIE